MNNNIPYYGAKNNLTNENLNANTVSLNSPNLNIKEGNSNNEFIPSWLESGIRPSNSFTSRAKGLEVIRNAANSAPKFKLGAVPGIKGGRRRKTRKVRKVRRAKTSKRL